MRPNLTPGQFKFYLGRAQNYFAMLVSVINLATATAVGVAAWYWWLLLIPIVIGTVWLDKRYVLGDDLAEYMRRNPAWKEMLKRLDRIEDKITGEK
jgi:hypothetical protein